MYNTCIIIITVIKYDLHNFWVKVFFDEKSVLCGALKTLFFDIPIVFFRLIYNLYTIFIVVFTRVPKEKLSFIQCLTQILDYFIH